MPVFHWNPMLCYNHGYFVKMPKGVNDCHSMIPVMARVSRCTDPIPSRIMLKHYFNKSCLVLTPHELAADTCFEIISISVSVFICITFAVTTASGICLHAQRAALY